MTLKASTLIEAKALGLNVSAIAQAAIEKAVREARRAAWLEENAAAFQAQDEWIRDHGNPLADIMAWQVWRM